VQLLIADRGIGIKKQDQKKVFDQFYRVSTGNVHDVKGFGLGLSYVKAIVTAHGGNISVESTLGKGSTFKVFLPFHQKG
jgi:two-component system phosphate regulon sensor histidine kinase PhoR